MALVKYFSGPLYIFYNATGQCLQISIKDYRFLSCLIAEGNYCPRTDRLHLTNSDLFSIALKLKGNIGGMQGRLLGNVCH